MSSLTRKKTIGKKKRQPEPTASELLVVIGQSGAELWHDAAGRAYATITVKGAAGRERRENHRINSTAFRRWLAGEFYGQEDRPANSDALSSAIGVLESAATFHKDARRYPTAVRIGHHAGATYLDLADPDWQIVQIDETGWLVISAADCPIRFTRPGGLMPLRAPSREGPAAWTAVRNLLGIEDEATWILVVTWLVGVFMPAGPYPVLCVGGEQGSGKSILCRLLKRLADPNAADLRTFPKDERDLMIAASNSLILAYDNLSGIRPELADALCRLSTGGGFAVRSLYTNDEEQIISATRPILLNGIGDLTVRPDLLERSLCITLPAISEDRRREESTLWAAFDALRPALLGAILDAVSAALANLSSVKLDRLPRMADFARWIVAAEPALSWKPGAFIAAYDANRKAAESGALEASPIGTTMPVIVADSGGIWTGTAADLLAILESRTPDAEQRRPGWPKNPRALSAALDRLAPALRRAAGITYDKSREAGTGKRILTLTASANVQERPSQPSQSTGSDAT